MFQNYHNDMYLSGFSFSSGNQKNLLCNHPGCAGYSGSLNGRGCCPPMPTTQMCGVPLTQFFSPTSYFMENPDLCGFLGYNICTW